MALTSLAGRLLTLPQILVGPVLRRTEPTGVTVFVALREAWKLTLRVYSGATADGKGQGQVAEGTRSTVRLGDKLHAVAVTAKTTGAPMRWGTLYYYDLFFGPHGGDTAVPESGTNLFTPGVLIETGASADAARKLLLYPPPAPALPSFPLPPEELGKLRIVHGSCRKAHGPGRDVLPTLDRMIEPVVNQPLERPQQLFMTGDQIYADDVPDALLALLTDAGNVLAAPSRKLPQFSAAPPAEVTALTGADTPSWARPGGRMKFVRDYAGFSSGEAKSHLLSLNEFYAQYLFAWSDVLWPSTLPVFEDIYPALRFDLRNRFREEVDLVRAFREGLPAVRRALAHIPSYTMFDDHEVTDDWFISLQKCKDMLEKLVGYHVIQNGLLAYAIFQAWGNDPAQFASGHGQEFLEELEKLDADPASWTRTTLARYVGPPSWTSISQENRLPHGPKALDWHYTLRGANHEVVVLDTRTWRSYPDGMEGSPALISREGFERQLPLPGKPGWVAPPGGSDGLTFLVAPAPVIDVRWAERAKGLASRLVPGLLTTVDAENWGYSPLAFETLLSRLFQRCSRVVVLSGDVHYGYAAHVSYWARQPWASLAETRCDGVLAQLTSSGFRNQWIGGHTPALGTTLHTQGYYLRGESLPPAADWAGWNSAPAIYGFGGRHEVFGNPPVARVQPTTKVSEQPHWRYRVSFVLAKRAPVPASRVLMVPLTWSREKADEVYLEALDAFREHSREYGAGKEIVGKNNLGEVTFEWGAGETRSVTQKLWWRLVDDLDAAPFTEYAIPLRLAEKPADLPLGP